MLKKITTLIVLIALSFFILVHQDVKAEEVGISAFDLQEDISTTFSWSSANGGSGKVTITGLSIGTNYTSLDLFVRTLFPYKGDYEDQVFFTTSETSRSKVSIHQTKDDYANPIATYNMQYHGTHEVMAPYDTSGNYANLINHKGYYMRIELVFIGVPYSDYTDYFRVVMRDPDQYKSYIQVPVNVSTQEITDILDLPMTDGSIYNMDEPMGHVTFDVNNYTVDFEVVYDQNIYRFSKTFASTMDMSIFDNAHDTKYYSYEDERFILISHEDGSVFDADDLTERFIPYTIWNLDSNELKSIDRYNVYIYLREEDANRVYAYFYVDEFVIDNLLSATFSMEYRYISVIGTKGSWQPYSRILEADVESDPEIAWYATAAAVSTAATAVFASIPIPQLSWPLFIVGTGVSALLQYYTFSEMLDGKNFLGGNINEITTFVPTASLLQEINTAYTESYPEFNAITANSEYKLFKLNMGSFNEFFQDHIEVRDGTFSLATFTYVTDGQVYEADPEDYNVIFNPGTMAQTPDNPNFLDQVLAFIKEWGTYLLTGAGIIAVVYVVKKFDQTSTSVKNIVRDPKKLLIFGVFVVAVLLIFGII